MVPKGLRLLLVEDQDDDAALLLRELARLGYEVSLERVQTRDALAAALHRGGWDLVISDFLLPDLTALEALALCRDLQVELPFLIVSGTIEEEDAVESMRLGAHDFITKGRLARLGPAIARGLREYEERRALRAAEERLRQSQKMEAIGQLAGGVAHDFNNLLGVIQGYGELLLRDMGGDERSRGRVEHILQAAQRGAGLTRQLLAFSRQQPLEARPLDLNAVVTGIESMLRRLIGEHVQVVTALAPDLHRVSADQGQIEQVLLNLAINARDAIGGTGRLIFETSNVDLSDVYAFSHPEVRPGSYAMLAVSDTGHGMDAETLGRAFEPFFTTKEPGKGTGLGLATVYGIVRQSGGHIVAYSEKGRGTTFKIYLPRTEETGAAAPSPPAPERPSRGTETVLLVEDDETLREVIRDLLEEGGYTVVDGETPEKALDAAARHAGPIHLVLTDLVMPRIGGGEAAARVHASHPEAKVLYMSGYTGAAAEHNGPLAGRQPFLQKPFSLETLLRKLREVLDSPG